MKRNLKLIIGIFLSILVLMLLGDIITIGDKIKEITKCVVCEYVFYSILALLFVYLIIRPMIKLHNIPDIETLSIGKNRSDIGLLRDIGMKYVKSCSYIEDCALRAEHKAELKFCITHAQSSEDLVKFIDDEITIRINGDEKIGVRGIESKIVEWAKTVFMVTAISPNSKIDAFSALVLNFSMIKDLILASGFRPTNAQMFKLYFRILTTSLLAYCVSDALDNTGDLQPFSGLDDSYDVSSDSVDSTDCFTGVDAVDDTGSDGFSFGRILSRFKIPGFIVGPVMDGVTNSLLTLRIGYVTKAYLTEGMETMKNPEIRRRAKRTALASALKVLPSVVKDGSIKVGRSAVKITGDLFSNTSLKI